MSLWLAVAGICLGSSVPLGAGEKILFGSEKSKLDPDKKGQLSKETFKGWKDKIDTDPVGGELFFQRSSLTHPLDLKKEKQQKLKRLEELNWMFVKPGELQDENDKGLAGKEDDASETLVKEEPTKNLMFRDLLKSKTPGGPPSASGKSGGVTGKQNPKNIALAKAMKDDDEDSGQSLRASSSSSKSDSQTGIRKELDFKKLFDPASSSTGASDKSDSSMASLFKPGSVSVLSREQQAMREEFRSFVSGSPAGTGIGGASDLPKLGGMSANPLMPKPGDSITRTPGLDSYSSGVGRVGPGVDTGGRGNWNYGGGVSGFGTLPPANLTPAAPSQSATPSFEPNRARGMGSLGGH